MKNQNKKKYGPKSNSYQPRLSDWEKLNKNGGKHENQRSNIQCRR